MKIFSKENLHIRVFIGFVLGIILGIFFPSISIEIKFLGNTYLNLIKMLVTPIVFCSVYCGVISLKDTKNLKGLGFKAISVFTLFFVACCILTLGINLILNPGAGVSVSSNWEGTLADASISGFLSKIIPSNLLQSFVSGDTLSIIIFTIFFAIASLSLQESPIIKRLEESIEGLKDLLYEIFGYFMEFSPIGVFSLISYSVATYGSLLVESLMRYILVCWISCIACFILIHALPSILIGKVRVSEYLKACGKLSLITMSTTSSAATLPTTINVCKKDLNCKENIVDFVAPLGCTIHMCGGACSFMCLIFFVSQINGISLPITTWILTIIVATLINMAAPGIPGGGIIIGATFLSIFGLPLDFIGVYSGIYRILDMPYTTLNVLGDVSANVVLSKIEENKEVNK